MLSAVRSKAFLLVLVCVSVAAVIAACGNGSPTEKPRQIDVSALTFEDVQQRALTAIGAEDKVLHLTTVFASAREHVDTEAWIDAERDLARKQSGGQISVYYERRIAMTGPGERLTDARIDSPLEKTLIYALGYLMWILEPAYTDRSLREGAVDGNPAIIVQVSRKKYDYDAIETAKVYLDESFLPLRLDYDSGTSRFGKDSSVYRREFVDRESIAPGFFSPDAVSAVARTPLDDLAAARTAGLDVTGSVSGSRTWRWTTSPSRTRCRTRARGRPSVSATSIPTSSCRRRARACRCTARRHGRRSSKRETVTVPAGPTPVRSS